MRDDLGPDDLDGLLERPLVAVLATYRSSGDVLLSPVWHRWRDGGFDVVTGGDDVKARHLRGDPRASIVLFESDPPYRGIEVRGRAVLGHADADVVRDIAVRYLGDEKGGAYADRGYDDTLIRLEPGRLRAWDSPMTSEWRMRSGPEIGTRTRAVPLQRWHHIRGPRTTYLKRRARPLAALCRRAGLTPMPCRTPDLMLSLG